MKEQIENAKSEILSIPYLKGCITGSSMIGSFDNQDIDVFLYSEADFTKAIYAAYYNPMFLIIDPLEKWKYEKYINEDSSYKKLGLISIKFKYNTCIDVNFILKRNCNNVFSVLSSFDMDIVCIAHDIQSNQILDLTNGSLITKVANWNKWNNSYYSTELWDWKRLLRQLDRVIKYHKRGYCTDQVIKKYLEIIDNILNYENIFSSSAFSESLTNTKSNLLNVKSICELWLSTHSIKDEELKLLNDKLKSL
jgi:hypothetical protein